MKAELNATVEDLKARRDRIVEIYEQIWSEQNFIPSEEDLEAAISDAQHIFMFQGVRLFKIHFPDSNSVSDPPDKLQFLLYTDFHLALTSHSDRIRIELIRVRHRVGNSMTNKDQKPKVSIFNSGDNVNLSVASDNAQIVQKIRNDSVELIDALNELKKEIVNTSCISKDKAGELIQATDAISEEVAKPSPSLLNIKAMAALITSTLSALAAAPKAWKTVEALLTNLGLWKE